MTHFLRDAYQEAEKITGEVVCFNQDMNNVISTIIITTVTAASVHGALSV